MSKDVVAINIGSSSVNIAYKEKNSIKKDSVTGIDNGFDTVVKDLLSKHDLSENVVSE